MAHGYDATTYNVSDGEDATAASQNTNNEAIEDALDLIEASIIDGTYAGYFSTLQTSGAFTCGGTITLGAGIDLIGSSTSDITFNTNKFTVAGATGNTIIAGTLGVTGVGTFTAQSIHNGGLTDGTLTLDGSGTITGGVSITSTAFVGALTGNADTATLASTVTVADTTDSTCSIAMFEDATGSLGAKTDGGLTYNATTGVLTATGFSGPLTGNVTGQADTVATITGLAPDTATTQATQTAITQVGKLTSFESTGIDDNAVGATAIVISSDEEVTMPLQPAFNVTSGTQDNIAVGSYVEITLTTEIFDIGSNFTSNTFTAPITGLYQLNGHISLSSVPADSTSIYLQIATSNRNYDVLVNNTTADMTNISLTLPVIADMDTSDTAVLNVYVTGTVQTDIQVYTRFSGFLAC
jgi:hypothetical protein